MLLAQSKIMTKLLPLFFQGVESLILYLPPSACPTHKLVDVVSSDIKIGNPTETQSFFLVWVVFPVFNKGHPEMLVTLVQWCVINDPKAVKDGLVFFVFNHHLESFIIFNSPINVLEKKFVVTKVDPFVKTTLS